MKLNEKKIDKEVKTIRENFGDIPIFAFIDWGGTTNSALGAFSQKLNNKDQVEFLKIANEFFHKKGIIFIYPIHGGTMGREATKVSFGNSKVYDSLAPEFKTYDTISEIARNN